MRQVKRGHTDDRESALCLGAMYFGIKQTNDDLLEYCSNRKITLLAYSCLLSGAHIRKHRQFDKRYEGADTDNHIIALKLLLE